MRHFFKKWLAYEERNGNEETQKAVITSLLCIFLTLFFRNIFLKLSSSFGYIFCLFMIQSMPVSKPTLLSDAVNFSGKAKGSSVRR